MQKKLIKLLSDSYATLEKSEENKKEIKFQWNGNGKKGGGGVHKLIHGGWLKILTSKQMLQRLPIELAQLKAGNTSENLLDEIRQITYSL